MCSLREGYPLPIRWNLPTHVSSRQQFFLRSILNSLSGSVYVASLRWNLVSSLHRLWFDSGYSELVQSPYPFLSLESDPYFIVGGATVGLFIVRSAGSLLLYHFLIDVESEGSQIAVLWGFICLGFGGALLRVTLPTAVKMLLKRVGLNILPRKPAFLPGCWKIGGYGSP
jgi:hypothetical protein